MKKTVIIYESKYGSTKRYAQWIAEALSCPVYERKYFRPKDFADYQVVIYGGGLYAGGISGIQLIAKNASLLTGKKVILFTCGLSSPENPDTLTAIRDSLSKTFSPDFLKQLHHFHFRGGIDYAQLSFVHKSMMAMLRKMLLKKDEKDLSEDDRYLLETYGKHVDFTDRTSIQPLIDCAQQI